MDMETSDNESGKICSRIGNHDTLSRSSITAPFEPSAKVVNDDQTVSTTNTIQVTNVSPSATLDQMKTLFGFLGDITDIQLYQGPDANSKVCFVEFAKHSSVILAQHLTNTVFIDRALTVSPHKHQEKPRSSRYGERSTRNRRRNRRASPRRRSRSRDRESSMRRRSRSRSRDRRSRSRRSRSRELKRRRSPERSRSKHHKSSRR